MDPSENLSQRSRIVFEGRAKGTNAVAGTAVERANIRWCGKSSLRVLVQDKATPRLDTPPDLLAERRDVVSNDGCRAAQI